MFSTILAAAACILLLALFFNSRRRYVSLGNKIPGPPAWPLIGNAGNFLFIGMDVPNNLEKASKLYGPTFRLWVGTHLAVFVSDPQDLQVLLSSTTLLTKAYEYFVYDSWLRTGLLISTGKLWQMRRKAIVPTLHFKVLEDFVPIFNRCGNTLVNIFKQRVNKGPFIISNYIGNCALDSVVETVMGIPIKAQENPSSDYVSAIHRMSVLLAGKVNNPLLAFEPVYTASGQKSAEAKELSTINYLPRKVIEEKESEIKSANGVNKSEEDINGLGLKKRTAFLEFLLKLKQEKNPAFTCDQDVLDEVTTFMFEGHDTITSALSFTLYMLGTHPEVQDKVYEEVSEILGRGEPQQEDLNEMKYLERVIKETLRLFPPVPGVGRKLDHDIVLPSSGLIVPAGASFWANIWTAHRNPSLYPEPDRFDPDRFLPENHAHRHPYSYVPFSAGPRNCIGQKFAMLDLKAIVSKLVYHFVITAEKDLTTNFQIIVRIANGPKIRVESRLGKK